MRACRELKLGGSATTNTNCARAKGLVNFAWEKVNLLDCRWSSVGLGGDIVCPRFFP